MKIKSLMLLSHFEFVYIEIRIVFVMDYLPICHQWNVLRVVGVRARSVYYSLRWVTIRVLPSRSIRAVTNHCIILYKRCNFYISRGYRRYPPPIYPKRNFLVLFN